ncbi:Usp domain-containing protein [Mycena venus]|uniref:Usp domain-containing protein n=1 Tax=Mycena venus TaxID=2733690 RepID=A0A8H6YQ97_9AGAR|nr:Usp domain-containing protein [Mycena venus]
MSSPPPSPNVSRKRRSMPAELTALQQLDKQASQLIINALERTNSAQPPTPKPELGHSKGSFSKMSFSSMMGNLSMGGLSSLSLTRTTTNNSQDKERGRSLDFGKRTRSSSHVPPASEDPSRSRSRARSQSPFSFRRFRQQRDPSPTPQALPLTHSDIDLSNSSDTSLVRPSRTAFTDDGEDSDNDAIGTAETDDEEDWSGDEGLNLFDPVTERNTEHNSIVAPVAPQDLDGGCRPTRGTRRPRRRKSTKHHEPLALHTSRPIFQRDRCTITITQGDPDAAATKGKHKRYIVASDLSEESRYAVEWGIGTVIRDGDEMMIVNIMENEAKVDPPIPNAADRAGKLRSQQERQGLAYILCRQATGLLQRTKLNVTVVCQAWHAKNARHMLLVRIVLCASICGDGNSFRFPRVFLDIGHRLTTAPSVWIVLIRLDPDTSTDIVDYHEPQMLIVGSRGLGQLKGILLGSTSHYLIEKCSVPVMVARRRLKRPPRRSAHLATHRAHVSLAEAGIDRVAPKVDADVQVMREELQREDDRRDAGVEAAVEARKAVEEENEDDEDEHEHEHEQAEGGDEGGAGGEGCGITTVPTKRKKKPPACDACKARRVLCHPQPEGVPCPRCKTTPVQRGRPRKATEEEVVSPSASEGQHASTSGYNDYNSIVAVRPRFEPPTLELPPELVQHLIECLDHFPGYRFPLFDAVKLKAALASVSWQLDLLPPQVRVLASCVCALSASISYDPAIIGPSDIKSFTDSAVFFPGADLRTYGMRRAPMCRALYERAFTLACETRIHIDVSEDNATSCFFLDVLERPNTTSSRPWAIAYISQARILAGCRDETPVRRGVWSGFIMAEALAAMSRRMPVLFTHNDQLLMCGGEKPSLEQLFQSLQGLFQASKKVSSIVFTAVMPYMYHVTVLGRDLYDKITGDYARRQPIAEAAVIQFLSSLSILQSILALVLTQLELPSDPQLLFFDFPGKDPVVRREEENLRSCAFAMTIGFTCLVLALHKEIEHRVSTDPPTLQNRWLQERTGVLQRQVHEMASLAVGDVARSLQLLPSLPHLAHLEWGSIHDWVEFCLAEVAATVTIEPTRAKFFETFITALKLFGYSYDIPRSNELIERMEACLAHHNNLNGSSLSSESTALSQLFPFDNNWTGMFGIDQLTAYDSDPTLVHGFL